MCDCISYEIRITADDKLIVSGVNTRTSFEVVKVKFSGAAEVAAFISRLAMAAKIAFPEAEAEKAEAENA